MNCCFVPHFEVACEVDYTNFRCHNLAYLSVCFCEHISEAGIELLGQTHSLTSVDISGSNCGDQGLSALGNSSRRDVTLSECASITDLGLQKFAQQCKNIERLDLSHCMVSKRLIDQTIELQMTLSSLYAYKVFPLINVVRITLSQHILVDYMLTRNQLIFRKPGLYDVPVVCGCCQNSCLTMQIFNIAKEQ